MLRKYALSAAVISVAGIGRIAAAAIPTIYPLGISSGSVGSRSYAVNDSGQVAVTSFQLFGQGTAARYDGAAPGGTLSTLAPFAGYQNAFANAINSSGQVAGHAQISTVSTPIRAFRYDGIPGAGGIMRDLGTLGGANSDALGINDLGQVTGYANTDPSGPTPGQFAFVYTGTPDAGGVMTSLGSLGGTSSYGAAINNSGQVAGSSNLVPSGVQHPFRYDGAAGFGVMHDLGLLPGFASGSGAAINSSGQVVGEMDSADGNSATAFRYTGTPGIDGIVTALPPVPGGTISSAVAINDAGFVLGFSDNNIDFNFHPILWRPDGSIIDLEAWLDAANPSLGANWDLTNSFITDISNTGLITGDGIYRGSGPMNNRSVAFVLDASSLVPEPANLALLGAGLVFLKRRSRAAYTFS